MKPSTLFFIYFILYMVSCAPEPKTGGPILVIKGATLFDGKGEKIENSVVVIHDGMLLDVGDSNTKIPDNATVQDASGKFITPGLIDAHVHFAQTGFVDGRPDAVDVRDSLDYLELQSYLQLHPERYYEAYLRSGVTGVYDVGGFPWSIGLQQSAEGNTNAPHVAAAGPLLTPVAQDKLETFNTPEQQQLLELRSPEFGRQQVKTNSGLGSTGIKIWQLNLADDNFMESLKAVAEETRAQGNKLIVHATTLDQAKAALNLEAKVLVHSVEDTRVDVSFLAKAKETNTIYIPTLVVLRGYLETYKAILDGGFDIRDPHKVVDDKTRALLEGAQGFRHLADTTNLRKGIDRLGAYLKYTDSIMALNLYRVYKTGIRVAVGTDAGNPGTLHGISIFDELEAFQDAGIPARDIIVMATKHGAAAMNRSDDLGTLEPGKAADLIILEKDPSTDIANMRTLTHVMRSGVLRSVSEDF